MKLILAVIFLTIIIWLTHNNYLVKISKLEQAVAAEKIIVENLKKQLDEKQTEYDRAADLKKLEIEMKETKNMEPSKEINYFKIKNS